MITSTGLLASLPAANSAGAKAATAALLGSARMAQEGQHGTGDHCEIRHTWRGLAALRLQAHKVLALRGVWPVVARLLPVPVI